jgi:FAD/FMN-containing dehydrogenase/Fe-S oxidoreductase
LLVHAEPARLAVSTLGAGLGTFGDTSDVQLAPSHARTIPAKKDHMPSLPVLDPQSPSREHTIAELTALNVGQMKFDRQNRMLYATDGSIYQVEPLGVVIPTDTDQVQRLVTFCFDGNIALLPRGGGTSLAGQCTNEAVVLDLSAFCRRVISINASARLAQVEPGITIDELNRQLAAANTNLFFAPDPATIAQAAIGGCIGNNAAGARSIRYGRTSENIAGLEVVLGTGQRVSLGAGAGKTDPIARKLASDVIAIATQYAEQIRARFPKLVRRNAGYGLDLILQQLDHGVTADDLDLTGLICGSEGTLVVVIGAKLKLHPIPVARGLALISFATLEDAINAVGPIVATNPTAVELLDDVVLEAAAANHDCQKYLSLMPPINGTIPKAVLYVEYSAESSPDEIQSGFDRLANVVPHTNTSLLRDAVSMGQAWALRKAGEPLLHNLSATRKPQTFVEDNSVPIENLPRFVAEFKKIVARHGTSAAYYAHASVGVLHIRPMIDLHEPSDRDIMRAIAVEVADLARDCGGVMSGEHGDGRVRGPLLERFFGPELMQAFREIKAVFDPHNILNPGNIVGSLPVQTITEHLRVKPESRDIPVPPVDTYFEYEDQHGFAGAVEMCNGAGFCRKTAGGTMCPSYRATLDERHSTRGRGNALRLAITGQLSSPDHADQPAWADPGTIQTLDLCLSCKACKSECPSNVDIARLKSEYTAQRYRHESVPLKAKMFGHVRWLNRIGSMTPGLANRVNSLPLARMVMNKLLGLSPHRQLPEFGPSLFRWFNSRAKIAKEPRAPRENKEKDSSWHSWPLGDLGASPNAKNQATQPKVILFPDCFTTYSEPQIGRAAVHVLETLGYEVLLPKTGCCGRAMISTGLLDDAITTIDATAVQIHAAMNTPGVVAIVVAEPSCLSAITDEWQQLKVKTPRDVRRKIADNSFLVEDFVERFWDRHPHQPQFTPSPAAILHGHCHQKALWGDGTSSAALNRFTANRTTVLTSGCCGMAGSFGYTADHYDLSMKIGELSVFPPIRAAKEDTIIVAPGTSCRHQIRDGTGRKAIHPIELIAECLKG